MSPSEQMSKNIPLNNLTKIIKHKFDVEKNNEVKVLKISNDK